jgi:hypothetical protein
MHVLKRIYLFHYNMKVCSKRGHSLLFLFPLSSILPSAWPLSAVKGFLGYRACMRMMIYAARVGLADDTTCWQQRSVDRVGQARPKAIFCICFPLDSEFSAPRLVSKIFFRLFFFPKDLDPDSSTIFLAGGMMPWCYYWLLNLHMTSWLCSL